MPQSDQWIRECGCSLHIAMILSMVRVLPLSTEVRLVPDFLDAPPRHLFFTGKGGVGKTSLACASAVWLADRGRRVLIVSTDPASNLDAVLGTALSNTPVSVSEVPGLHAMNIDPEQAATEYRERTIGPYKNVMPGDEIATLVERLSGACTVEVAAFDEFALLLSDPDWIARYDHVIFDTAPTGHTLRLLELPAAWTGFLEAAPGEVSCLGPLSGLKTQRERYARAVAVLADANLTAMVVVARPDRVALLEAGRTTSELRELGLTNQSLVVNGVFRAMDRTDRLALAVERRATDALTRMPEELAKLRRADIPLLGWNLVGVDALRSLFARVDEKRLNQGEPAASEPMISGLGNLVDELAKSDHGLIMVMGKGGVGKTTVAASIAVGLAHRGLPVHLTTTDPAQHIQEILQAELAGLRVSCIDPKQEVRDYRHRALEAARPALSPEKLELLREELESPCYEEVAVFQAFSRIVMIGARQEFVVVDTAPTGHTLLLLDTAGSYHRQITQQANSGQARIRTTLMRLQDANYTKIVIVALPETTPVLEASELQDDLRRASIEPFAWVINGSLAAAHPRDPVLKARAAAETAQITKVRQQLARRIALIPFQAEEPIGIERLGALSASVLLKPGSHDR
jgi:arsenite-transporting ATPase